MAKNDQEIKRQKLIQALLLSDNVASAAKATGISERTARRWMTENAVKQALFDAKKEAFQRDLRFLRSVLPAAIRTLYEHAVSPSIASGTRVRAAQILLDSSLSAYRMYELEERLMRIEERLGTQ